MNRLSDEWFSSKSESVPLWHKIALSIDEMYVYTGIGRETIRELTKQPEAKQFTLKIGKRTHHSICSSSAPPLNSDV